MTLLLGPALGDAARTVEAHGIGGAKDLPISPELAVAGAVAALTISFTVLALAWRTPRYASEHTPDHGGHLLPDVAQRVLDSRVWRIALRVVGLLFFAWAGIAAVAGQDLLTNPFFGMFYVWWWVGIVPASLLLGPVWRAVSPVRTLNLLLARASGSDPERGVFAYPARWGYWPAALGLFAFVWLELVYPYSTELGPVRLWAAVYVAVMLVGGALFGNTWYARADPFEVYSSLVAKLSVWGSRDGRVLVRSPLSNLATIEARPGLVAVVAVLFGSTGFDSFRESPTWVRFLLNTDAIASRDWAATLADNLALIVFCGGVGLLFAAGTMLTGVGSEQRRIHLPGQFAHSMVPIIVGYIAAHYLSYWIEVGQDTLIKASDPMSTGANYLGTGDWRVNYWLSYHPTLLANLKVAGVVLGHVVAVVAAHDRAITLLPKRHQLTGQLPLLALMVGFTAGGLFLLFAA
ncbi:hypothetical protein I601_2191 [Nocardioides dokdonensis FR1436]|uniref:Fenitrothion hydrolase n=1 Tax=Nocardioides dokdonensis FR1436 TaxID=1300347 RepID=A0A1A9GKK3_9ACTN|nr:hypothetical protein [Nocardioides dokdonensis]ANH38616.1 hypothetical protein I601_2191 [Nocardioides dokdonensis FR1436]